MNGIRLPDPINPSQEAYIDNYKNAFPKNNNREVKFEPLINSSPRYTSNYDIKDDSSSRLRQNNNVPQIHALGRNVLPSNDNIGHNGTQNRIPVNNRRRIGPSNRNYNQNYDARAINYESLYNDLNNTTDSSYTERISSVDSFEYKYYRSNDPDRLSDIRYNDKFIRNNPNNPTNNGDPNDKDKFVNYQSLIKARKDLERLKNDFVKNRIANEMLAKDKLQSYVKDKAPSAITQIVPGTNLSIKDESNKIEKPEIDDNNQLCQLTKEELFNGFGSFGLALSKVFSLTGRGVLYLCSSVTDNTEALFDTDKNTNDTSNNRCAHDNAHTNCKYHPNKDYSPLPDLHINYDTNCTCEDSRHNHIDGKQNVVYVNGRKAEIDLNNMDDTHILERDREYMVRNRPDRTYRNMNYNIPIEYDRRCLNHPKYYNKINNYNDNLKIDYDPYVDYFDNNVPKNDYYGYNDYEDQTTRNLYRDREIDRFDRMPPRAENNMMARDYSFDDVANRNQYDPRTAQQSRYAPNMPKFDNKIITTDNTEQKINANNRRTVEFNRDNGNSNGFDKYKNSELVEKNRNYTMEAPSFGKPNISAYGTNTTESVQFTNGVSNEPNNVINNIEPVRINRTSETQMINNVNQTQSINKINDNGSINKFDDEVPSTYRASVHNETIKSRNEPREPMDLKNEIIKVTKDLKNDEFNDKASASDVNSSNMDKISLSNYSAKTIDRISIGDDNSTKSIDRISLGEIDSNKSVDGISMGDNDSNDGKKKKSKRRVFPFYKKSKEKS